MLDKSVKISARSRLSWVNQPPQLPKNPRKMPSPGLWPYLGIMCSRAPPPKTIQRWVSEYPPKLFPLILKSRFQLSILVGTSPVSSGMATWGPRKYPSVVPRVCGKSWTRCVEPSRWFRSNWRRERDLSKGEESLNRLKNDIFFWKKSVLTLHRLVISFWRVCA